MSVPRKPIRLVSGAAGYTYESSDGQWRVKQRGYQKDSAPSWYRGYPFLWHLWGPLDFVEPTESFKRLQDAREWLTNKYGEVDPRKAQHELLQALLEEIAPYVTGCTTEICWHKGTVTARIESGDGFDGSGRMCSLIEDALKGDGHENPTVPDAPSQQERIDVQYPGVLSKIQYVSKLMDPWRLMAVGDQGLESLAKLIRTGISRTPVPNMKRDLEKTELLKTAFDLYDQGRTEDLRALTEAAEWSMQHDGEEQG